MRFAASDGDLEFFSLPFSWRFGGGGEMYVWLFGFECGLGCWSWVLFVYIAVL